MDRCQSYIITDYGLLCFRSFWRSIPALWSFICCSTSGFLSSMHLNMTSLPANTGSYSKSVTLDKLVRKVSVLWQYCHLFVLFPVSPACVTLSTSWRGCWRRCSCIASLTEQCRYATSLRWDTLLPLYLWPVLFRSSSTSTQTAVLLQNCSYYWGFAAWMAYYINHPLYTPPSEHARTHTHTDASWVNSCPSYLTLTLSCCSIRGATNQTGPHRVLGIHFSVAMILLDVCWYFIWNYISKHLIYIMGKKNSHLALKWSNCTLYKPGTELVCILSSVRLATFPSTLLWGISAHQVQTHNSPDPNNHGTKCWFRSCISFLHLLSFTVFAQVLKPERSPTPPRTPSPGSSCWCPVQTIHMR